MIKNILVSQDGSAFSESALRYSLWLAEKFDATLTGIHVVDSVALEGSFLHDISGSMGFEPFLDFSSKMRSYLEDNGKAILKTFLERAEEAGVKAHKTLSFGVVSGEICESAKLADLVVMGRRGINAEFEYSLMGSVTESVVRRSSKPVFIVPETFVEPRSPVLAFDGSVNSSKAMHSAAEFSKAFSMPLTVLTVASETKGVEILRGAEEYIEPYGIKADFVHIDGDSHIDIVKYCAEKKHDLVFMGSSHHSRVVELVLGSTTEYVMRKVEAPFFLER
ncbi:MAG: universal stress protein [Thermodesulfobacteriota bacterium]